VRKQTLLCFLLEEKLLEWVPKFAAAGTTVIDNLSWGMDPTKKLIVPEINASFIN
jgi:aspartate-semialdehyde dehydrogenase